MKIAKCCPKNSGCRLWQMLCDGNPCEVEKRIKADSYPITGRRNIRLRQAFSEKKVVS